MRILKHSRLAALCLCSPFLLLTKVAFAADAGSAELDNPERRGTWNLIVENDSFTGTDRNYTSGVQMSYLSRAERVPNWLRRAAVLFPDVNDRSKLRAGFSLGHSIFTPTEITQPLLIEDDRPYASYLYGGIAVVVETETRLDTWLLNLGIVGPSARGEEVQNGLHEKIGSPTAEGWTNQLRDQLAGALVSERRWRNLFQDDVYRLGIDINPHVGFSLGNTNTYVNGGVTLRVGNDLANDFGPPRIRPSLPGSSYFETQDGFAWYLFAGIDVRYVAYNGFLERDPDRAENKIDPKVWVADAQAGAVLMWRRLRLSYTYIYRTDEFEQQLRPDEFGSLALSVKL